MEERSPAHAALGRAIRELRTERGLSQEDLAHLSDTHVNYIGGIERGERNPSFDSIRRIAAALGVPSSGLLAAAEDLELRG